MKSFKIGFGSMFPLLSGAWALFFFNVHPVLDPPFAADPAGLLGPNRSYGQLPLYFEPNEGQTDPRVKFLARGDGYGLFLTAKEAVLVLNKQHGESEKVEKFKSNDPKHLISNSKPQTCDSEVVRIRLSGSNPNPVVEGLEKLSGTSNYFTGNDPSRWRTRVPNYSKIKIKDVYPGIDMVYYGNQRHLEYDFVVAPGADPQVIRLALSGTPKVLLDTRGNLVVKAGSGEVVCRAPRVYQWKGGQKKVLEGRYASAKGRQFRFEVPHYDPSQALVIDPVLDYSTYLGGSGGDTGLGIAVDSGGNAYITGQTSSTNFPTTSGAFLTSAPAGSPNAFVAKLNPAGTALVYSTYLGGSSNSYGQAIVVDPSGDAYVTGHTDAPNFPLTSGAFQTNGGTNAGVGASVFFTEINPTGASLVYSTYLGGTHSAGEEGLAIALDSGGDAYITGITSSSNFPTTSGAYQTSLQGEANAFVTELNPLTGLVYSTYLGGSGEDAASAIALDKSGDIYVAGRTESPNFPTTNGAYQTSNKGSTNGFMAELNASHTGLTYSTYIGGASSDACNGIALDSGGNAYLTGTASSTNFPTTAGAYQSALGGSQSAFVAKLNPSSGLAFSSYLGGNVSTSGTAIAVNGNGNAYVTGFTQSSNFPTTAGAFQTTGSGTDSQEVFLTKFNAAGTGLVYSTYLAGSGSDNLGEGIVLDAGGDAYLTGTTSSQNFPTTSGAYQTAIGPGAPAFVAKFDATAFNTPTPTSDHSYSGTAPPTPGTSFVYPSPAKGSTVNVAFDMQQSGTARVLVWNEGAELVDDVSQSVGTGAQFITLNIQGWAKGVYFYRVELDYGSGNSQRLPPDKFLIWR